MDSIRLVNFRCFRHPQQARLAPLTLLVGDNGTGKTSFMAMIRALWQVAWEHKVPDFKEDPYDLGSFDEIAHHRGRGRAERFEAGFVAMDWIRRTAARGVPAMQPDPCTFHVVFERSGTAPIPVRRRWESGDRWIEEHLSNSGLRELHIGTSRGSWKVELDRTFPVLDSIGYTARTLRFAWPPRLSRYREEDGTKFAPLKDSPEISDEDLAQADELRSIAYLTFPRPAPYASAPVRSRPRRTYDPARAVSDPEGDYVPMYLANMYFQNKAAWASLKEALEGFGHSSGLFDEIDIMQLGKRESEPFQLQIRKRGAKLKGPPRNLIDSGYGVSQVLPVITELLRGDVPSIRDAPSMFLLQQPEVHLHPSAQAALGSLLCRLAGPDRQLIVETHSDHLLDRVRMDVRDESGHLTPEDVSILYFERTELDVHIHSLRLDGEGNVLDAPPGYRQFFLEETRRSLGL